MVVYTLCGSLVLPLSKFNKLLMTPLFDIEFLDLWFGFSISLWSYLYRTKSAFQTDWSFLWHWVLGLKLRLNKLDAIALPHSNDLTSNLISLFFLKKYHWPFDLDGLFEIQTDPGFVQNQIWGLGYYRYTDWCDKVGSGPRGSKAVWVDLLENKFEHYKDIYNFILIWCLTINYSRHFMLAVLRSRFLVH